jgi:hypothetical protein
VKPLRETDLYQPVKRFLRGRGYDVKGEIGDCDIAAVKDGVLVAVEMKTRADLNLLLQASSRLSCADGVYLALPHSCSMLRKGRKDRASFLRLLKMLGLGVLVVNASSGKVAAEIDPCEYTPRKRRDGLAKLLAEHAALVGDPNPGGSSRRQGRMTAYRQRAIAIAQHLFREGQAKASDVRDALAEPSARQIMYDNVYGWFERKGNGIYSLSPRGGTELAAWVPDAGGKVAD